MKRRVISFMLALSLVTSGVSAPQVDAKSKAPKVSKSMTLTIGQSKTIKVKSNGTKVKKKTFKVTTKKGKRVISVSKKGKVKAKKTGSAKVQVTIKYKAGKKLKTKKSYIKIKVTSSKTTVTQKPSSTSNTLITTNPSVTTSTPTSEPSETPDDIEPSETPTTKPTETPSSTATSSPSSPSSTPTTKPIVTPGLNLDKDGIKVESGVLTSYNGSAESIDIPEGVEKIGESALEGQEIKSVSLPRTLKTISAKAFKDCTDLEEVECPESVEEVGDLVWSGCTSLKTLSIPNEDADIGNLIVDGCTSLEEAYIPAKQSDCTHNYMKIQFDATCTAKGKDLSICKDCGNIVDIDVPALGHDAEVIKTDATCTASGKEQKVCKRCEVVLNVDIIPAKGHTEGEYKTEKEPTCEESGTSVKRCTACNKELDTRVINPLGHTEGDFVIEKNATCSEAGLKVKHCTICDKRLNNTEEVIEKLPHNYGLWTPVINPTCVLAGSKQRVCKDCGHIDTADIDLLGHDFSDEYTVDKEPTCTEKGSKSQHCSRCDEVQNVTDIPALGHKWGKVSYEWSEDGKSSCTATRVCKNNSSHIETREGVITSEVVQESTCTEKGYTEYTADFGSLEFGIAVNRIADIDKKGHNWGEPEYTWSSDGSECTATRVCQNDTSHVETEDATVTSEVKVEPTCTESGITEYTAKFNKSAFTNQTKDIVDIPAIGHSWKEPTYTWSDDGKKCTATRVCNNDSNHVETEDATITSVVEQSATCTEKGTTKYTAKFNNNAFATQTKSVVDISATGHNWGTVNYSWSADNRNCTATRICENDPSHVETETSTVKTSVKIDSTCEVDGTTTYTAEFKNTAFETQTKDIQDIDAIGHSYGEPTYTWSADGRSCVAKRICNNDPSHIDSENAKITSAVKIEPDCTTKGTTTYTATFENGAFESQTKDVVDINALGHDYDSVVIDPTCLSNGYTSHTCSRCSDNYVSNMVPATGHDYGTPTYTWGDDGKTCTAKVICNNDNSHIIVENAVITSKVKTEATCTEKGTTTYTATFSNGLFKTQTKDVQDIAATEHNWGNPVYTWSDDGKICTAKRTCSKNSSHIETESAKITSNVKTEATCTTNGTTTYTATFSNTAFATQTKDVVDIPAIGHSWGTVSYLWGDDGKSCTATRVCQNDSNHVETELGKITDKVKVSATCEADGTTTYTATFENNAFATQTKDVVDIPATGHIPHDGYCTVCNEKIAGLYDKDGNLLCTWEDSGIDVETDYMARTYKTSTTSPYYIITNNYPKTTKVVIPEGVTSIGNYAFCGCSGLTSITIPDKVTSIGEYAFFNCSVLTSITISDNVTSIGDFAFYNCLGLTNITIPEGVTSIGDNTFSGCTGLTNITIPDSVTSIGSNAFSGCTGLTSITIPNSVTSIGDSAFYNCSKLTSITIPNSVTSIGYNTFNSCTGLTSITIPDGLTSIEDSAFYNCSGLTSIIIPDGVVSIGEEVFSKCTGLTSITIPDSVTSIGDCAFCNCSGLTSITIPEGVTSIGFDAFMGVPVVYYDGDATGNPWGARKVLPYPGLYNANGDLLCTWEDSGINVEINYTSSTCKTSTTSPNYVITKNYPDTTKVIIPDSVTSIGNYAFYWCYTLTDIIIPDGVTSIGNYAFGGLDRVSSIKIPEGVVSIGDYAFQDCADITSLVIPNSVISIGNHAFYQCAKLTSVIIGDGVTSIDTWAFYRCSKLTSVTFKNTTGWYVGDSAGAKTTAISSSDLTNTSTATTYLKSTYSGKYWTR